ncbi:MAG TPA: transposase [Acidisphaera sp.]|nr:transposase [Acidisphaera sp.]
MPCGFRDQGGLFSDLSPEARIPADHPLREVRRLVRDILTQLNPSPGRLYASEGRPTVPPEQLLSALLLQVFFSIRSERQLIVCHRAPPAVARRCGAQSRSR